MDSAFKTARYPGSTNAQLLAAIEAGHENAPVMQAELERRAKVAAGDRSVMTDGERLRTARKRTVDEMGAQEAADHFDTDPIDEERAIQDECDRARGR